MRAYKLILRQSVFTLILFFAVFQSSFAQHNNFKTYGLAEGLSRSNAYSLLQDSRAYLWVGTNGGGVNKFDGTKFVTYTKKDGLSGNTIRCMLEDSKGRIWFGTDGGITIYDGLSYLTITANDSLKGSSVISLLEDRKGRIWAGTDDGGVNRIIQTKDTLIIDVVDQESGLTGNSVFDIYEDEDERIWLAILYGGLNIIDETEDTLNVIKLSGDDQLPSSMILSLEEDLDGNIWCGTYDVGAFQIKPSENSPSEWNVVTHAEMDSSAIWDIYCRKNGEIWLATGDKGMIRCYPMKDTNQWHVVNYSMLEGLPINQLLCLEEDMEGNMWIGTNGEGICKFLGDHFSHYVKSSDLSSDNITDIRYDGEEGYWLATDGGGLNYFVQDQNGRLKVKSFTKEDGLPSDYLTAVFIRHLVNNPYLWVGTTNKGIAKFDGKKFTSYTTDDGLLENRINDIYEDGKGIVWIATAVGISKWDGDEFINVSMEDMLISSDGVNCIIEDKKNNIWIGTTGAIARYDGSGTLQTYDFEEGLNHSNVNCLAEDKNGNIWIGTNGGGIYYFDLSSEKEQPIYQIANDRVLNSNTIYSMEFIEDSILIVGSDRGMDKVIIDLSGEVVQVKNYNVSDGFLSVECNANAIAKVGSQMWIGTGKGLTRYDWTKEPLAMKAPIVHISAMKLFFKDVDWKTKSSAIIPWTTIPENLELSHRENHVNFHFNGISTTNPEKLNYKYKLEGHDDHWSPVDKETKANYSGLSHGTYTFKVMAVNADGIWSEEAEASFSISPPWYQTIWFYIACVIFVLIAFAAFTKYREKKLQEEKHILEQKVYDRTQEIREQKDEIEEKNKEIVDSINYAERIQSALLTEEAEWEKINEEYFVFFKPKDVVSGDFFWAFNDDENDLSIWVAADCTGHGVPGAFMSMLGIGFLNEIVIENNIIQPSEILNLLRDKITKALEHKRDQAQQKDGMDIALCVWDKKKNTLEYSGANNPLWIITDTKNLTEEQKEDRKTVINDIHDKAIIEFKPDKQPVGFHLGKEKQAFTNEKIKLNKDDIIYSFSDGFPDQFGGPKGKKFMYKPFKRLLLNNNSKPLKEQKEILNAAFNKWKGDLEQIDDVCVIGVKV